MNPTAEEKTDVARIVLIERDGSETIINVTEDVHFIFGYAKASPGTISQIPMEISVKGVGIVVAEIFYQIGEQHPLFVAYCVSRESQKVLEKVTEDMKAQGTDPLSEILKNLTPRGDVN